MAKKAELASRIWSEFVTLAQGSEPPTAKGFPSMIPSGDGKSLFISDEMEMDIFAYAQLVHESSSELKVAYGSKAITGLVRQAFGTALSKGDSSASQDLGSEALQQGVERLLNHEFSRVRPAQTYVFGCWLISNASETDLHFGPVRFERRLAWLDRARAAGHVSAVIHRRIQRRWRGENLRPLKNANHQWRENAFLDAVGDCPDVCTVATNGLAADVAYEKAVLAARLGMTAVALLWERPSRALEGFGLLIERQSKSQRYVVLGRPGAMGSYSGSGRPVGSTWVAAEEWSELWGNSSWLTGPFTEILTAFLDPDCPSLRPQVTDRLLHALWWFYEACRAEAPLMATVKLGACLDTLAGGKSEGQILKFLEKLLGPRAEDSITRDGRTARSVVKSLYGQARSRTLHGNNDQYHHDWRGTRDLAEHLIRFCFVELLSLIEDNPAATNLNSVLEY